MKPSVASCLIITLLCSSPVLAGLKYQITWIGDLPGGPFSSSAVALNDREEIIGPSSFGNAGADGRVDQEAFLWQSGKMQRIPLFEKTGYMLAHGINDLGQVAGTSWDGRGFVWTQADGLQQLTGFPFESAGLPSTLKAPDEYRVYAINNLGQTVGSTPGIGDRDHLYVFGFIWQGGQWIDLGGLPNSQGVETSAYSINNLGVVVGGSSIDGPDGDRESRAFVWQSGAMKALPRLPGDTGKFNYATDVNDRGQIVGVSNQLRKGGRATLWDGDSVSELPALAGDMSAYAAAINDQGLVVGRSILDGNSNKSQHDRAVLWSERGVQALDEKVGLPNGAALYQANDINASGQIAGIGRNAAGQYEGFLLTPLMPGDANGDGVVNGEDLGILKSSFGDATIRLPADFSDDDKIDFSDFGIFKSNWSAEPAAVPEPMTATLAILAALLVRMVRRFK